MSTLPQRQIGIFISVGLAVVGAAVAGVILFRSGQASEVELTSADFVPADAAIYFGLNTDLASDQWVAAFNLIERLGQEEPFEELQDTVEDEGDVDWEEDVVPFLGGNAAVFFSNISFSASTIEGGVIVKVEDGERALEIVEEQSGLEWDEIEQDGFTYLAAEDEDIFVALYEGHLIGTTSEETLFDIIDVRRGEKDSIADAQDFKTLRDELTKNFLAFAYINAEDLYDELLGEDETLRAALEDSGAGELVFKPLAFVVGAEGDAFEVAAASVGQPGTVDPMLEPRESRFVKIAPAQTSIFFSTHDLAGTYDRIIDQAGDQIDEAIVEQGEYRNLDEALQAAGEQIGLRSAREIIDLLTGEVAVALWFPTGDSEEPDGVFLAEVDEEEARRVIESILETSEAAEVETDDVNGVEVTIIETEDGDEAAYAITDGYILIGTRDGVEETLEAETHLSDEERYKDAESQVPTKLGTWGYFDLAEILRLSEAGVPSQLDEAERALQGAIINLVNENDVARVNAVVIIK